MNRRNMLLTTGAAIGLSALPLDLLAAAETKRHKVLYFTRTPASSTRRSPAQTTNLANRRSC